MNDEIIINGVIYVKKYEGQIMVDPNRTICCDAGFGTTEKKKQSIQDYCKEHRLWATKDVDETWHFYTKSSKPSKNEVSKVWVPCICMHIPIQKNQNFQYPNVPWDKSLIAPDGRLILIEGKKPKQKKVNRSFKVGKRYISIHDNTIIQIICAEKYNNNNTWIVNVYNRHESILLKANEWEIFTPPKKAKKQKLPARGELIFCRNNDYDKQCPSTVRSFHHIDKATGKVHVWADGMYGVVSGSFYDSWKPFKLEDY